MRSTPIRHRLGGAMALLALILTITMAAALRSGLPDAAAGGGGADYLLMLNPELE